MLGLLLYVLYIHIYVYLVHFIVPCAKFGPPYPGKAQQPQEQRHPFPPRY